MDKNTIIGFFLMLALVLGYSYLTAPTEEELRAEQEAIEQADLESSQQADELDQAQINLLER